MPKKKKKKGADKDKKAKKKPGINEREVVYYEQQIQDNNRQLARLRSRNEHLEAEVEGLKGKLSVLEDDRSDIVAHLKRILQQKVEEARELSERLLAMEELRREELTTFKAKEEAMRQEYNTMETNLSAEVKLVAGKLNALEEWRNARAELTLKFEIQERQMAEQEDRHAKTLYEAEKSLIIGKAKMQKDMEERLNELALSFHEATDVRIADATKRAIRENIVLHRELATMLKSCQDLEEKIDVCKEKEQDARLRAELYQKEAEIALAKVLEQNQIIEALAEEHIDTCRAHSSAEVLAKMASQKKQLLDGEEKKIHKAQELAGRLEKNIQEVEDTTQNVLQDASSLQERVTGLEDVFKAVSTLISELTISNDAKGCACDPDFREKLVEIYQLLENLTFY